MCTDPMGLCVFAFFDTARLFKYWCVGLCALKQERKSMCFLVHNPIAHVCGLRIGEGLGERHRPGASGGFPGPAPSPASRQRCCLPGRLQGVGAGEAEAAKAAGRCPINPACALSSLGRGCLECEGWRGECGFTHVFWTNGICQHPFSQ